MLRIAQSNRLERLAEEFIAHVAVPCANPLAPIVCVVSDPRISRWLSLRTVDRLGVCANIDFPLPAGFVWSLLRRTLPQMPSRSSYEPDVLRWRLLTHLDALQSEPGFEGVNAYLASGRVEMAYELCEQVAKTFDRYLVDRPDWIRAWEAGRETHWQAHLWRALREQDSMHWVSALEAFFDSLEVDRGLASRLPESVSFFALSSLSATYLEFVQRLSQYTDITIYSVNPCQEYWGDIESPRRVAKHVLAESGRDAYRDTGNRLLASLGHSEQANIDRLIELDADWTDAFWSPWGGGSGTILAAVQTDVFELTEPSTGAKYPLAPSDRSIQIHACHSPMREAEVLHDRLLEMLHSDSTLRPSDIAVLTPDPKRYLGALDAVFGGAPRERRIPYTLIEDVGLHPRAVVKAFLGLLDVVDSRFEASRVIGLLECPAVQRRFGLTDTDLPTVNRWVRGAGIRWGADASDREALGLSADATHTWRAGLDRLLLGLTLPEQGGTHWDVVAFSGASSSGAELLGRLATFIEALIALRERWTRPRPLARWAGEFERLLGRFFEFTLEEFDEAARIRAEFAELRTQAALGRFEAPIELALPRRVMQGALRRVSGASAGLVGNVTIGGLRPGALLPARVVCIVGANDDSFPRRDRRPSFDLTTKFPRRTDRSLREDDRFAFLQALLTPQEAFYISYVGFDVRDQSAKPPSAVVAELTDYLERHCETQGDATVLSQLVTAHPLHPFSRRYFTQGRGSRELFSYAQPYAEGLIDQGRQIAPFFTSSTAATQPGVVALEDFVSFFLHPARYYLRHALGVVLHRTEDILEDDEPFVHQGLGRYHTQALLAQNFVTDALPSKGDMALLRRRAESAGVFPFGAVGDAAFGEETARAQLLHRALIAARGGREFEASRIDLAVGGLRIDGTLHSLVGSGLSMYRPGRLRPKDRLNLWVRHLLLCAARPEQSVVSSFHGWTEDCQFNRVPNAQQQLCELVALFRTGLIEPIPLFTQSSFAYSLAKRAGGDPGRWLDRAQAAWLGIGRAMGEAHEREYALLYGQDTPLDERFASIADAVFQPLLDLAHYHEAGATPAA
ncbi:MAG: exodeoxyribonuclease V subunit gamma [Gammaproteobacteria bacterium]|nr:exodeoxyribonuclease V subunit gamma [Gammaproteobacteria bacterium]